MNETKNEIERNINSELNENLLKNLLNRLVLSINNLIREKNFDEAIETINKFYRSYKHQDSKSNLEDTCNAWLALVYEKKGNYSKALEICELLACKTKPDYTFFINRRVNVVRNLYYLKEYRKAVKYVEETIDRQINGNSFEILCLLKHYTDVLDASQSRFPTKYRSLIETIIQTLSPDLGELELSNSDRLAKAVRKISELNRNANLRYSNLVIKLSEIGDKQLIVTSLEKYISEENFEFYRNLAVENLRELKYSRFGK